MNKLLFPILMAIPLVLTGCWDRYELEERANILGIAVDAVVGEDMKLDHEVTHLAGEFPDEKQDTLYKVTAQIALPGKIKLGPEGGGGEGSEKTAWILETYGHTMRDAMANLQQQLAEKLYLGHLQIVVVSEDVAKNGLSDINDFLRRDHEVRRTAWMVVNGDEASNVLNAAPPVETVPSLYLSDTLDNAVRFGKLPKEYLGKFWIDISDVGIDGSLPAISVIDEERIMIDGLAYFKDNEMVGRTSPIEIGAYMDFKGKNSKGTSLAIQDKDGGVYILKPLKRKSSIEVSLNDGNPSATVNIQIEAMVEEEVEAEDLGEEKIDELEQQANLKMAEVANHLIKKFQEKGSDAIGIGARVRSKFADYWDVEIQTDEVWSKEFKGMEIDVNVSYEIKRTGMEWN